MYGYGTETTWCIRGPNYRLSDLSRKNKKNAENKSRRRRSRSGTAALLYWRRTRFPFHVGRQSTGPSWTCYGNRPACRAEYECLIGNRQSRAQSRRRGNPHGLFSHCRIGTR